MSHDELRSLLGAYAVHAVDPDEAEEVERHVEDCPRCNAELSDYMMAAPLLGSAEAEAPEGLWEEVVASIDQPSTTGMRCSVLRATRRGARWRSPLVLGAAALAAAAAIVVLALSVSGLENRVHGLQHQPLSEAFRGAAQGAMNAPHETVYLRSPSGHPSAQVVVGGSGHAYLVASSLPKLAAGRTYQLWTLSSGRVVSLGVLGRVPVPAAFRVEHGMSALMITAEPAGGVPEPDSPILVKGALGPT
ncbi:MAG: anti-sigma factor [Acidimicrobiales bacterium]